MNAPSPSSPGPDSSAAEFAGGSRYTLEILSEITGVSTQTIRLYQEQGLIRHGATPAEKEEFDDEAVRALRRLEHLRASFGVELSGLKWLTGLLEEIEQLRAELRARR